MPAAEARVATEQPDRYLKQLCRHFGHRVPAEFTDTSGSISFTSGACALAVEPGLLVLRVTAGEADELARLEDVVARHLQRFAHREELDISWAPANPDGTVRS